MGWADKDSLKANVMAFWGLDEQVKAAGGSDMAKLLATGFRIKPNALHDNLLKIKFMKPQLTGEHLKTLVKVKNQLLELDLSNTNFDDEMSFVFSEYFFGFEIKNII